MKLIYIAYGNVSVFDSQVVSLLNHYIETKEVNEIILILGIDYKETSKIKITDNLHKQIIIKTYRHFPQYFLIEKLTILSLVKTFIQINDIDNYVIHVRNDVLAHYVYKACLTLGVRTNRIVADVRGAGLEQLIEFSKKNKCVLKLKKFQRKQVDKSLKKINNISVVSKSLKKYLVEKLGNNINIKINSCLSDTNFRYSEFEREILRETLNIESNENLLVLSTGGNNAWQNTEETIAYLTKKNFKVLNLSRTVINHKNVINRFIPYREMFKYLCAADVAIIWRDEGITNKVASPVKFSEYVCCGLPVITNDAVDLITDYIKFHKCGEILDSITSINDNLINNLKNLDRDTLALYGQKNFDIDIIANQYVQFYDSVLSN